MTPKRSRRGRAGQEGSSSGGGNGSGPAAPPNTCALWLRDSTQEQNPENQAIALEQLADQRGLNVVKEYRLEGKSAYKGRHVDDVEEALRDAATGHFTHFLFWALDRLDRRGMEASLSIVRRFREAGVQVISHQEPWLERNTDDTEMLIGIAGHYAKMESKRRSERLKAHFARARAEGKWPGGTPPYAYRVNEKKTLVVNPERVPTVERIYHLYVDERLGIDRIQEKLRDEGIQPPKGGRLWSRNSIWHALTESSYAYGKHARTRVAAESFIPVERYERAQELLKANKRFRHAKTGGSWPLNGMICGACGSPFGTDSGPGHRRTYFCRGRRRASPYFLRTNKKCDAIPCLPADVWEPRVLRTLIDTFESPEAFDMAISSRIVDLEDRLAQLNPDGDDFDAEEAGIAESQEKLSIEFIHGRVSRESKEKLQRDLDDHREALQARREAAGGDWEEKVRETKRLLQGAKDWAEVAERRLARGLRMVAFDFGAEFAETDELTKLRKSDASPFKMPDSDKVPEALSQWLNRLHAKLFAFQDRIEVRGLLSFDVGMDPDGDKTSRQASLQGRGSG